MKIILISLRTDVELQISEPYSNLRLSLNFVPWRNNPKCISRLMGSDSVKLTNEFDWKLIVQLQKDSRCVLWDGDGLDSFEG